MADSNTGSPLAGFLAALGWTPEKLGSRLSEVAMHEGWTKRVHPKTPYKWVSGESFPRSPWRALTAAVLTEALHREVTPAELGWPADDLECVPADASLAVSWDVEGALHTLRTVTQAGDMDRRLFLTLLGSAATSPAHEWLIAHPPGDTTRTAGARVPPAVVDHLDQISAQLRQMDDQMGGGQLLDLVHQHLRYVTGLLDEHRYTDTVGRRLHSTAGELLRLAGFISFDSARYAKAQRYWTAALHAAHTAGDRALGANVLGFWSCMAKDIGQIRESIILAETARAGYGGASPAVTAILQLRIAEAHANEQANGRAVTQTRQAVDAAFDVLGDSAASSGMPDWCYWMDEAQAAAQAGYCYLTLGDHTRARIHLRRSLDLQNPSYSRERALRHVLLATTYLQQNRPELDQALAYGDKAVEALTSEVDSARCVHHISQLLDELAPYRPSPSVGAFIERTRPLLASG